MPLASDATRTLAARNREIQCQKAFDAARAAVFVSTTKETVDALVIASGDFRLALAASQALDAELAAARALRLRVRS